VPNPVTEFQLLVRDPELAAQFYARTFGWEVDAANALGYRRLDTGAGGIAGGIWPAPPEAASRVQLFIAVPHVAEAVAGAERNGARTLIPAQTLPDGDEMAVLLDPLGISFGLVRRARRRGLAVTAG
jgi:predicted enzyme related to lactoylglutathione lyase